MDSKNVRVGSMVTYKDCANHDLGFGVVGEIRPGEYGASARVVWENEGDEPTWVSLPLGQAGWKVHRY